MIRGDYNGTMLYPQYEPNGTCQWYYMSGQDAEDVLLFKGFDTREGSVKCTWIIRLEVIQDTNRGDCRYSSYIIYALECLRERVS